MKSMPKSIAIAAILSLILSFMAGCNTTGCLENRNSVPLAGFYIGGDKSVSIKDVEIRGVDNDAVLYEAGKDLHSVYLPMRSTQESTSWVFSYKSDGLDDPFYNDTIKFDYSSRPYFASEECGVIYIYDIKRVSHTTHLIDSVILVDSTITNVDKEQIHIYFHSDEE